MSVFVRKMMLLAEKFHAKIFFRSNFLYLRKNIHITEKMFITLAPGIVYRRKCFITSDHQTLAIYLRSYMSLGTLIMTL